MKLAYENFSTIIETSPQTVTGIIIENPSMLYRFLADMRETVEGQAEKIVLSSDNKIVDFSKNVELLTDFIRFDLNQKALLSKIMTSIDQISQNDKFYDKSQQILARIESHIMELTIDFPCELEYEKLNMLSVIKAMGISLTDDYSCLEEKLLAYMDMVRDFLNKKLFILVNCRGFIPCHQMQDFVNTTLQREHEILFVDNMSYPKLLQEKRLIIDEDLCEI